MSERNSKGLCVLLTFLRNEPLAVNFVKLAKVSSVLLEEVERRPSISKVLGAANPVSYPNFWKLTPDEALIDWAYRFRKFGLKRLSPKKNAEPYQIISKDDYDKLVDARGYVGKHFHELSEKQREEIHNEAKNRKEEASALYYANEDTWTFAEDYNSISGLMWLVKNFTMKEDHPLRLLTFLAARGKLSLMKEIYEAYRGKIDWDAKMRDQLFDLAHPFCAALTEDRARVADWLAARFDMSQQFGGSNGQELFRMLTILNNKPAVE